MLAEGQAALETEWGAGRAFAGLNRKDARDAKNIAKAIGL